MSHVDPVIELLSSKKINSGTALGDKLGISRVAVKKRIDRLISSGVPIEVVPNQGYKLQTGVVPFCQSHIESFINFEDPQQTLKLELFAELASTNQYLIDRINPSSGQHHTVYAVLSESQPQGHGRRGRAWLSAPYRNIALSLGFVFPHWPENPSAISLAFSVAVHRALIAELDLIGVNETERFLLKWPNDLVSLDKETKKLGGLLVSASGEAGGFLSIVMGVGLNVDLGQELIETLDQPATDLLSEKCAEIDRNQLVASIINYTADMLSIYPQVGFQPFADYWNKHAAYIDRPVRLFDQEREYLGVFRGVDASGELILEEHNGALHRFSRSDLSLRPI